MRGLERRGNGQKGKLEGIVGDEKIRQKVIDNFCLAFCP